MYLLHELTLKRACDSRNYRPILASVKSSASIFTPADSITAIIPLLSLGVGAAIHGTDV